MFVVDKMVVEDRQEDVDEGSLAEVRLPDGATKKLGPSSKDAYSVLEDLCLLASSERPYFLKLESLQKTFALELIESVLTNYHDLFRAVSLGSPRVLVQLLLTLLSSALNSYFFYDITFAHYC